MLWPTQDTMQPGVGQQSAACWRTVPLWGCLSLLCALLHCGQFEHRKRTASASLRGQGQRSTQGVFKKLTEHGHCEKTLHGFQLFCTKTSLYQLVITFVNQIHSEARRRMTHPLKRTPIRATRIPLKVQQKQTPNSR